MHPREIQVAVAAAPGCVVNPVGAAGAADGVDADGCIGQVEIAESRDAHLVEERRRVSIDTFGDFGAALSAE